MYLLKTGKMPEHQIDHEDGNGLNNLWKNLKDATPLENGKNQRKHKNNTSGVVGVSWHKATEKWQANIKVQGNQAHLGLFTNKDDAEKTRQKAEIKYGFHSNHGTTRPL
jgi:hypothetical protein